MQNEEVKIAMRVSRNSILVNIILSLGKLIAGILGHSSAMVSDAVHSASDVFSTVVVIIGVRISNRESDKNHQYGHERLESVAAEILALILAVTGIGIGYEGIRTILEGVREEGALQIPTVLPLIAALLSVFVKEAMYWYTIHAARRIHSGALKADAWHHRSDALSSVGSFVGVLGARIGFPVLDAVASVVICGFILKAAFDIFADAVSKMTDQACDDGTVEALAELTRSQEGVQRLDDIKTRMFGNKIYVDIEISVDGEMKLREAHQIAEQVHDKIEEKFPLVKHCMVHVNPHEMDA